MNIVPPNIRFETLVPRVPRRRAAINTPTFSILAFAIEFVAVITLALLTGAAYHLTAYGAVGSPARYLHVGVVAATVYAVVNTARGDDRLGNVLGGKVPSSRILIRWNGTLLCLLTLGFLAQRSAIYSRAWIALFYLSGLVLLVPLRRLLTRATLSASRNGIVSAKRIFVVG